MFKNADNNRLNRIAQIGEKDTVIGPDSEYRAIYEGQAFRYCRVIARDNNRRAICGDQSFRLFRVFEALTAHFQKAQVLNIELM